MQTPHPASGLLIHLSHRLRALSDWIDAKPMPPKYHIGTWICEHHEDGSVKPEIQLTLYFGTYKAALAWAWPHCRCWDADKGADNPDYSEGAFTLNLIDFSVRCSYPEATRTAELGSAVFTEK